ncbi:MAG: hypothetical protein ACX93T_04405, partial [Bacteroidota bacterium]
MNKSHLTSSKLIYSLSILTMTATMLLSCNKTQMMSMQEEDYSFGTLGTQGTHHDRVTILESVPSQEANPEVPDEILVADTANRSVTDAHSDSISIAEIASIERRIGLDNTGSILADTERNNVFAVTQEESKSDATKIQSVTRIYNSNKIVRSGRKKDSKNPNHDQQLDLIKLGAVGASAFALWGYVNNGLFNQQKEREAQTAREEAEVRICQLEERLAVLEADKSLRTAVDFYTQPETLNNSTICQFPDFFNQSCLSSVHPGWMKAAPLGMSVFLVGGYVAQKVRNSHQKLKNQLTASNATAGQLQEQLEERRRQLKTTQGELRTATRRADQLQEQLEERGGQLETTQGELSTATRRADQLQEQLEER